MNHSRSIAIVIAVTLIAWFALAWLASETRETVPGPDGTEWTIADFNQAFDWAAALLGLASALGGLLGIAASTARQPGERGPIAEAGIVGLLGGATLLGIGGAGAPVGLAIYVGGRAAATILDRLPGRRPPGADGPPV